MTKICLSIAGLDPSGGAGTLADVKTFAAFGCFGAAAITSLTFQNTVEVLGSADQSRETIRSQIVPVLDDLSVDAVKTGMLPSAAAICEIAAIIREYRLKNIVVDPVVRSTSGFDLIDDRAVRALASDLFQLADIVTPNRPEAERLTGIAIESVEDIIEAAAILKSFGAKNVLIKGGHPVSAVEHPGSAIDHLFVHDRHLQLEAPWIETTATHGTGCVLSSAIAANLALGSPMIDAVRAAKNFVNEAIRTAPMIGAGNSPINISPILR